MTGRLDALAGILEPSPQLELGPSEVGPALAGTGPAWPLTKLPSGLPASSGRKAGKEHREKDLTPEDLETYRDRRRDRFRLRETGRSITKHRRLYKCGVRKIDGRKGVEVRERNLPAGRVAHYANLQACGAAWVCPCCGPKVREHRAQEADAVAAAWAAEYGVGSVMLLTATIPHGRGDTLAQTLRAVKDGWAATFAGSRWQVDKARYQVAHYMRAHDLTHGGNGWHPHFHAIVLARRELTDAELTEFRDRIAGRWADGVEKTVGARPSDAHGLQLERARAVRDVMRYVYQVAGGEDGKRELARELTRADLKSTKARGQRTPWQILTAIDRAPRCDADGVVSINRARDVQLWREYERATKGSHLLQWSRKLREEAIALGADLETKELTDNQVAGAEVGGPRVLQIADGHWWAVRRKRGGAAQLLRLVETRKESDEQLELFSERVYSMLERWHAKEEDRDAELRRRVDGWESAADRRRQREAAARDAEREQQRALFAPIGDACEFPPIGTPWEEEERDSMAVAMMAAANLRAHAELREQLEQEAAEQSSKQTSHRRVQEQRVERSGFRIESFHHELQERRRSARARAPSKGRRRRRAA